MWVPLFFRSIPNSRFAQSEDAQDRAALLQNVPSPGSREDGSDVSDEWRRILERRGPGLHHIAYEVDDLEGALAELKAKGVRLIDEAPRRGGRGHMVAFVHPKGNHGLLVELIQRPDH